MSDEQWIKHSDTKMHLPVNADRCVTCLQNRIEELEAENSRLLDSMERAWGVIANVSGEQTATWIVAVTKWCDEEWHPALDRKDDQ